MRQMHLPPTWGSTCHERSQLAGRPVVVWVGYGLANEAREDAIYDSQALRDFVGIDLSRESVPDAITVLKLRRLYLSRFVA